MLVRAPWAVRGYGGCRHVSRCRTSLYESASDGCARFPLPLSVRVLPRPLVEPRSNTSVQPPAGDCTNQNLPSLIGSSSVLMRFAFAFSLVLTVFQRNHGITSPRRWHSCLIFSASVSHPRSCSQMNRLGWC